VPYPRQLTDDVRDRIVAVTRAGCSVAVAAEVAGVSERTIYDWLARGTRPGRSEAPYRALRAAVEQARAEAEATLAARMSRAAARGSWRAAAWLLERHYPDRWAPVTARSVERRTWLDDFSAQRRSA